MPTPNYSELILRAAEATKEVEDSLRESAFAAVLQDLIRQARGGSEDSNSTQRTDTAIPTKRDEGMPVLSDGKPPLDVFLSRGIEAAKYDRLLSAKGHLVEKCLVVLKIARDEFGIPNLSARDLETILARKFRVPGVHARNVTRDLGDARQFVSPIEEKGKTKYLLTVVGDARIDEAVGTLG
jgi:hypothetical protein